MVLPIHQGIPIPRPQRHHYKKFMEMLCPAGLEPGDVGCGGLLGQLSRPVLWVTLDCGLNPGGALRSTVT